MLDRSNAPGGPTGQQLSLRMSALRCLPMYGLHFDIKTPTYESRIGFSIAEGQGREQSLVYRALAAFNLFTPLLDVFLSIEGQFTPGEPRRGCGGARLGSSLRIEKGVSFATLEIFPETEAKRSRPVQNIISSDIYQLEKFYHHA